MESVERLDLLHAVCHCTHCGKFLKVGAHMSGATCPGNLLRNHSLVAKILAPGVVWFCACGEVSLCLPGSVAKLGLRAGDGGCAGSNLMANKDFSFQSQALLQSKKVPLPLSAGTPGFAVARIFPALLRQNQARRQHAVLRHWLPVAVARRGDGAQAAGPARRGRAPPAATLLLPALLEGT